MIIIIVSYLIALAAENKIDPYRGMEKLSAIQYGYVKCGTHAREFFRTLTHGNSNIDIDKKQRKKAIRNE